MAAKPELTSDPGESLIADLSAIVGRAGVLAEPDELLVYECDGLPQHKHPPRAVIFPESTEQISDVLKLLAHEHISFAPRGAGTGLSGGALAVHRGVVIELARMRKILNIDTENRLALVQTGLVNASPGNAFVRTYPEAAADVIPCPNPNSHAAPNKPGILAIKCLGEHQSNADV